jgi:hypothetical protein
MFFARWTDSSLREYLVLDLLEAFAPFSDGSLAES